MRFGDGQHGPMLSFAAAWQAGQSFLLTDSWRMQSLSLAFIMCASWHFCRSFILPQAVQVLR